MKKKILITAASLAALGAAVVGYLHEQMHMVWHNFHPDDLDAALTTNFFYEGFQPYINTIDQDLTSIFWTPDHMILAGAHHIVALVFHRSIILLFDIYCKTI